MFDGTADGFNGLSFRLKRRKYSEKRRKVPIFFHNFALCAYFFLLFCRFSQTNVSKEHFEQIVPSRRIFLHIEEVYSQRTGTFAVGIFAVSNIERRGGIEPELLHQTLH